MTTSKQSEARYCFRWLIALQVVMYLEAGAVPALLIELGAAFDMTLASQGLLGGIVYLTLSAACPIAGALLSSLGDSASSLTLFDWQVANGDAHPPTLDCCFDALACACYVSSCVDADVAMGCKG